MERAVEVFAAIHCAVIGLSHIAQAGVWVEFFIWLRGKGRVGVFANGFLSLWFGSVIVAFHNVWEWPAAVLTLLGYAQVIKGLLSFVVPQLGLRSLERVTPERAWMFVPAGAVFLALSALFWYTAFTR